MNLKKFLFHFIGFVIILMNPVKSYSEQLSIGQTLTVYLNPSIPSGGWITSADWSTDVIGLNCFNGGTWGTGLKVDGYWSDTATLSCLYTYSYYDARGDIHVGHNTEYWYYTCQGYPVTLSPTSITLDKGEKATLTFKITGAKLGSLAARWVSSDTDVASVYANDDYSAIVTAKFPGTCTITCISYMGEPVECFVKVNSFAPTSISLSPAEIEVVMGKTTQLRYTLLPNGASATCTWESDNPSIATVKSGSVTGVSAGKTKIRVRTDNGLSAVSDVTVISNAPTGVSLTPDKVEVLQGKTITLTPSLTPDYALTTYTWKSDNPSIATVQNGIVTGVSGGKTKVWVQTDNGFSAYSEIIVKSRHVSSSLSGSGTEESPYIVSSAADLRYLSDKVNEGNTFEGMYFKQSADITINSGPYDSDEFKTQELWIPIGTHSNPFMGIYDGDNHVVSGICMLDNPELYNSFEYYGLFGTLKKASILNLKVGNFLIDIPNGSVGVIVGETWGEGYNDSRIENCHVFNGSLYGKSAAAIAHNATRFTIINCSNNCSIFATEKCSGICCIASNGRIYNCINMGYIEGMTHASGIVSGGNSKIYNCCNAGELKSQNGQVAGITYCLINAFSAGLLEYCVNYGKLSSDGGPSNIAALVYKSSSSKSLSIYDCFYVKDYNATYSGINKINVKGLTESEMKSDETLQALNNADDPLYSRWVAGEDGFPVFDWYKEFVAGVDDIRNDEIISDCCFEDIPSLTQISVYSLSGLCVYKGLKMNMPELREGYYIVVTPHTTFKLYQ